ncbi:hypothetical protein [Tamlana sp. I1]|uniref:hypothetical protein n=1 Tax=Tamlana sp. I1 TaxID=2762061 RepID=UPI00188FA97E|nr:hypothetical protein [Tamlana sp. I1]
MTIKKINLLMLLLLGGIFVSCSSDNENTSEDENITQPICETPSNYIFQETNAFIQIEFENGAFSDATNWKFVTSNEVSGGKYVVWQGSDLFNSPGVDVVSFKLNIKTPGIYRFIWKSAVTEGDNGTEHNDSWLRFADASDFYAEKNDLKIYPKDTDKTPNPNGSSKDGWFKVYRGGNDLDFKWQASTSDNDAHNIYVQFDSAREYTMEVSGRSKGHGIDQFLLFQETKHDLKDATASTVFNEIICGD